MLFSSQQISGLILAGGRGRRVAEQDKGFLCLQGKPMIEHQLFWFSGQVEKIMISANRNIERYQSYGWPVLTDSIFDLSSTSENNFPGPLAGLLKGLENCSTDWLFVQPVDMPLMPDDVIDQLCKTIKNKKKAYFLKSSERSHYLSMLISTEALPELIIYLEQGKKRVREFLNLLDAEAIDLGFGEKCFSNLNELSDYSDAPLSNR